MWLKQKCTPGPGTANKPSICDLSEILTNPRSTHQSQARPTQMDTNGTLSQ